MQELKVVLFGSLNNVIKGQTVKEIAIEFDLLVEDIKKANPNSTLSWATLPLPPAICSLTVDQNKVISL